MPLGAPPHPLATLKGLRAVSKLGVAITASQLHLMISIGLPLLFLGIVQTGLKELRGERSLAILLLLPGLVKPFKAFKVWILDAIAIGCSAVLTRAMDDPSLFDWLWGSRRIATVR